MECFVGSKTSEKGGSYCGEEIEMECCMCRSTKDDDALLFYKYCIRRQRKWYAKPNIIKYGDVEHKVTQTSIEVFPKKKLMKNPRKPTEIINEVEEETKKIVEKYKTKCNPKNKRLVKRDSKCDNEINIEHGHGRYECGDNGEWSSKCVLAYCHEGYKFDYINNKCIKDVCSNGIPISIIKVSMVIIGIITLIL
ncbi:hypothetical protein ENUP19_0101G0010 [Entamoeba nuttalli]|uniref:Uncharacterized protein n=1 Tax=Entamoeba nuttalli TaxID=412467 RepID=A0ABQ0DHI3_9EUKA